MSYKPKSYRPNKKHLDKIKKWANNISITNDAVSIVIEHLILAYKKIDALEEEAALKEEEIDKLFEEKEYLEQLFLEERQKNENNELIIN